MDVGRVSLLGPRFEEGRDEFGAVEVHMLRAENLTIEIFIDEDDDGVTYAEALMFTTTDKRPLARGRARLEPGGADIPRIDDGRIAAVALLDLVRALTDDECPGGEKPAPSPVRG